MAERTGEILAIARSVAMTAHTEGDEGGEGGGGLELIDDWIAEFMPDTEEVASLVWAIVDYLGRSPEELKWLALDTESEG
jgi:hypothetical protein